MLVEGVRSEHQTDQSSSERATIFGHDKKPMSLDTMVATAVDVAEEEYR